MSTLIERLFAAAGSAGFLRECVWVAADSPPVEVTGAVGFTAPDQPLMDGMALSTEHAITFPASLFVGIGRGDSIYLDDVEYRVREVRALGDGTEMRATLARV